jgi:hypothetical protein
MLGLVEGGGGEDREDLRRLLERPTAGDRSRLACLDFAEGYRASLRKAFPRSAFADWVGHVDSEIKGILASYP